MSQTNISKVNDFNFGHIGWRSYNCIKKKAMEQEFSWAGLLVNLSIAFFVVILAAFCLSCLQRSIALALIPEIEPTKIYQLEKNLPIEHFGIEKLENLRTFNNLS